MQHRGLTRARAGLGLLSLSLTLALGCDKPAALVEVDTEKEANQILVALSDRGVHGEKKGETKQRQTVWQITVPADKLDDARRLLVSLDLPRQPQAGFEGMFKRGGIIPTRTDERAQLMNAIAQELETTFEAVDGVVRARVHVVLPEENVLGTRAATSQAADGVGDASATVLIKYIPLTGGPAVRRSPDDEAPADAPIGTGDVSAMVAKSVSGLSEKRVKVHFTRAAVKAAAQEAATAAANAVSESRPSEIAGVTDRRVVFALLGTIGALALIVVVLALRLRQARAAIPMRGVTMATPAGVAARR